MTGENTELQNGTPGLVQKKLKVHCPKILVTINSSYPEDWGRKLSDFMEKALQLLAGCDEIDIHCPTVRIFFD